MDLIDICGSSLAGCWMPGDGGDGIGASGVTGGKLVQVGVGVEQNNAVGISGLVGVDGWASCTGVGVASGDGLGSRSGSRAWVCSGAVSFLEIRT